MISRATVRQFLSSSVVILCSFTYGCKVGFTESIIAIFTSPNPPFEMTSEDISWIASISYAGTIISLTVCYTVGSKVSRRVFLSGCALIFAISWLLILLTSSSLVIIVCFLFYGIAASLLIIIGITYIGEIASPSNREILGILYCIMTSVGGQIEFLLSTFNNYRLLTLFPLLASIVTLLSVIFMVESPYYLVLHGRHDHAVKNLCWLEDKTDVEDIAGQLESVKKYVDEQRHRKLSNLKTIFLPDNLKLLLAMITINLVSLIESSTITSQYGPVLVQPFQSSINGTVFVSMFNMTGLCGLFVGLLTVKMFSRKALLLGGLLIAGFIQLGTSIGYYIEEQNENQIGYLAYVIAFLLVLLPFSSAITIYASISVLKQEVFPHKLKEFYSGLLAFTSDCTGFLIVKLYPTLSSSIGNQNVLAIFAGAAFVGAALAYWCLRDTKGKSLYQIRTEYASIEYIMSQPESDTKTTISKVI